MDAGAAGMLDLTLRNTAAYQDAFGAALQAAIGGEDPQKALDNLAKEWDSLTKQVGVDAQRRAYNAFVSTGRAYPPGT